MIPGIDMLNHSTRPEDVNTSLQRREETVNRHGNDHKDSIEFTGFFAIEAGAPLPDTPVPDVCLFSDTREDSTFADAHVSTKTVLTSMESLQERLVHP